MLDNYGVSIFKDMYTLQVNNGNGHISGAGTRG